MNVVGSVVVGTSGVVVSPFGTPAAEPLEANDAAVVAKGLVLVDVGMREPSKHSAIAASSTTPSDTGGCKAPL